MSDLAWFGVGSLMASLILIIILALLAVGLQ